MKIFILGGSSRIAVQLTEILTDAGHDVTGTVRGERGRQAVLDSGGTPVPLDLETAGARDVADQLGEVDAVVFAAGAGYGSTTRQKEIIDRDGAILLADAAELAGVRRYVLISSMGTDRFDPRSADPFQIYLRLKSEADAAVRGRDLDWTIVRPSGLTDRDGTGHLRVGTGLGGGSVPRADVAVLIGRLLVEGLGMRRQFEVTSGAQPIGDIEP